MKTKSSPKKAQQKKAAAPVASVVASQSPEIPPGLEFLAELKNLTPVEQMAMALPKFAEAQKTENATEATESFAGVFWGLGLDFGVTLPEWVKTASEKAFQALGFGFVRDVQSGQPAALGKLVELANLSPKSDNPSLLENACGKLIQFIKTESGNLSADENGQYADGRKAVPKIIEKAKNPSERAMAFLAIAGAWREVEKLGSRTKTYKWLKLHKLISPTTEWDEVKRWLAEINLPKGKAGRPKNKIRTSAKSKNPIFQKKSKSSL